MRVYSEFARFNAAGEAVAPAEPREILSPALARNAFTSLQVVVQVPAGTPYYLHIGENPDDAARVTLYVESDGTLEPVKLPYAGEATKVFWMDVWIDRDSPVRRIKIEPEVYVKNDWITYPMEARVMEATAGEIPAVNAAIEPLDLMRSYLCTQKLSGDFAVPTKPSMAGLRARNAQQDIVLASQASKEDLRKLFGACDFPAPADPEWYLRIRDYLFRLPAPRGGK